MTKAPIFSLAERRDLFREAAALRGMSPAVVEKDFWVCWVLEQLFSSTFFKRKLLFKGGTSLSKVFNLIERFSEDIDLILNWQTVTLENPELARSKTQQDRFNKQLNTLTQAYLRNSFLPQLQILLEGIVQASINAANPNLIDLRYPAAFSESYLRPEIRLETGPLAAWMPNAQYEIKSYVAEEFPTLFQSTGTLVRTIKAERTFWEKATILHREAQRPVDKPQPPRYSRHYYDLMRIAQSPVKSTALSNIELLRSVVDFKAKFYPCAWAKYDLAQPGSFKLVPPDRFKSALKKDYAQMQIMIFGERPGFAAMLAVLERLEEEVNALS